MVIVSEKSIHRMLKDVAPRVERLTGWDLQMNDLTVKIIPRDFFFEQGIKPTYEGLGIDIKAKSEEGKQSVKFMRSIMPYIIMGLYEPMTGSLLICPENYALGTNESGLATLVGHELTHRGQFLQPRYKEMYLDLVRRSTGINAFDEDKYEEEGASDLINALMTLAEGDATFVQDQLKSMFYQDAENRYSGMVSLIGTAVGIISLLDDEGGLMKKMKQYSKGKEIVSALYKAGGREAVNRQYALSETGMMGRFG